MTRVGRPHTKRNVDLISSHDEEDEWSGLLCSEEPTGLDRAVLSTTSSGGTYDNLPPHTLPLRLRPGETLVEYEEFIPDVDRNEY